MPGKTLARKVRMSCREHLERSCAHSASTGRDEMNTSVTMGSTRCFIIIEDLTKLAEELNTSRQVDKVEPAELMWR